MDTFSPVAPNGRCGTPDAAEAALKEPAAVTAAKPHAVVFIKARLVEGCFFIVYLLSKQILFHFAAQSINDDSSPREGAQGLYKEQDYRGGEQTRDRRCAEAEGGANVRNRTRAGLRMSKDDCSGSICVRFPLFLCHNEL